MAMVKSSLPNWPFRYRNASLMEVVMTDKDVRTETKMITVGPLLGCTAEVESFPDMLLNEATAARLAEDAVFTKCVIEDQSLSD